MPPISLHQFTRLVDQIPETKQDSKLLQVKDGRLSEGGFFSFQSAKREAINSFVTALRKEYGSHVADMLEKTVIRDLREAGKPLTARLVKDLTRLAQAEKARVNEHNSRVVGDFLSGTDPDKSLVKAVRDLCVKNGLNAPGDQTLLQERIGGGLRDKAELGDFHPEILTRETLLENIGRNRAKYTGLSAGSSLAISSGSLTGTLSDRLRMADLGLGGKSIIAYERCVPKLEDMRRIQPEGDLTLETVHKALFNEDSPDGLEGPKLLEAIETRCERDMRDLLKRIGPSREPSVLYSAMWTPWETLARLTERPDTLTLADVPGFEDYFQGESTSGKVQAHLRVDPCRVGETQPRDLPVPAFSFQFPDGQGGSRTETVEVGSRTGFAFASEADKQAYLGGKDNSLSRRLESLSKELCGPEGTEGQVSGVMVCLGQIALGPLKLVSGLAGTGFDEHSNVSVSLSRQPDGTVKADFSSPEGQRDAMGQFKMSLQIGRDGQTTMTEFELTPPLEVRERRANDAMSARIDDALDKAAPFRALDDSQSGLFRLIRERGLAVDSGAKLSPDLWNALNTEIGKRIQEMVRESTVPLTEEQILSVRQTVVDKFFEKLEQAVALLPQEQHAVFVRGCLELGLVPDESLLPALRQMTGTAASTFKAILQAGDGAEVRDLMYALYTSMRSATVLNPDFQGKGQEFLLPAQLLAMRMGVLNLMGGDNPEAFAKALTRPGPFLDMLQSLGKESSMEGNFVVQCLNWFLGGMTGVLPDEMLMEDFNTHLLRERDLSLPRQREILGEGHYVTRGAGLAVPELAGLDQSLRRDMPVLLAHIRTDAEQDLLQGPGDGQRAASGLSEQFSKDFARGGIYVNGRYYHPSPTGGTGTTEQDFINLFPDSYTAGKLSNLAGQNFSGMVYNALVSAQPQTSGQVLIQHIFAAPALMGLMSTRPQNTRIETLDSAQGRYRITAYQCITSSDPESGVERYMYEVSVLVNLGAPVIGEGPRTQPRIEDVRLDMLIRGRETVPGEGA